MMTDVPPGRAGLCLPATGEQRVALRVQAMLWANSSSRIIPIMRNLRIMRSCPHVRAPSY